MLVLAACVLALASPLVVGRWPAGLLLHKWRWPWLVWVVLILQAVVLQAPLPTPVAATAHVATYVAALGFLWLNRHVPGVYFVAAGAFTNGLTIALNGGTLPASASAVAKAGLTTTNMEFANSAVLEDPTFLFLGDIFAWPAPLPLANTFSVGDVLIVIGAAVAAWTGSQRIGRSQEPEASQESG